MNRQAFYDAVRLSFPRGRLTGSQVEGMDDILDACATEHLSNAHTAYVLATAYHETGTRMVPVREGFCKTDLGSRRAVTALFNKGIISWNYGLPHKNGHSYYGRGYVQLTHYENYAKTGELLGIDLANNPDMMLDSEVSAKAMVLGMIAGTYRGKSLADKLPDEPTAAQWRSARGIINGDVGRHGTRIGGYANVFYSALEKANG